MSSENESYYQNYESIGDRMVLAMFERKPYFADLLLWQGDCLELMKKLPDRSVDTGRRFIGMELDEKYFNVAKPRIEKAWNGRTGQNNHH